MGGNTASKPVDPNSGDISVGGRILQAGEDTFSFITAPMRYGIAFWRGAYNMIGLITSGAEFGTWPNEVKWVMYVMLAVTFGLVYLGLSPFLAIPEAILEYVVYFQYEMFVDIWECIKCAYFATTSYFGVSDKMAGFTGAAYFAYVLLTVLEKVMGQVLFNHAGDSNYIRTYDMLCYPLTIVLNHLDPAFFTQRDTTFPYLSYAYDWFCAILIFPYQMLAALATPIVSILWTPENTWVAGKRPIIDKITNGVLNL